jgi:hypothetical protein
MDDLAAGKGKQNLFISFLITRIVQLEIRQVRAIRGGGIFPAGICTVFIL